jgi:hypothetical protein
MPWRRFRHRRIGRVRTQGGRWPEWVLVEVTATGLVIETPTHPELPPGTVSDIVFHGLRGTLVAESSRPGPTANTMYHTIRTVELDEGLLAELDRSSRSWRGGIVTVLGPDQHQR